MDKIRIVDKEFRLLVSSDKIQESINRLADQMNKDLKGRNVFFLGILNGAFMFVSDLIRRIDLECQISFLKLATYEGSSSSGSIKRLIGLDEDISGKTVVILEDIIDTGFTIDSILKQLKGYGPRDIRIAALLFKPDSFDRDSRPDYIGIEIPNDFVAGYGLDYKGYGRNLKDIYVMNDKL